MATPGEILSHNDEDDFERDSATDDTRVRTAVSWLETSQLLTREENKVQVFPSSLKIKSLNQAADKLRRSKTLTSQYCKQLLDITEQLIQADSDEGITTDQLMLASGMTSEAVRAALQDLETTGIATDDTAITAFVHYGVTSSSDKRLHDASSMEQALIEMMQEAQLGPPVL